MDERCTLNTGQSFVNELKKLYENKEQARLMIDDNGLGRAEGFIKEITENGTSGFITLDNGEKIDIAKIIAVNGLFTTDYTCC